MIKIGVVETEKRQMKKFWSEFKAFISKGNILDLAVGVVIGTAFNAIVTSLVNDLIMPLITWGLGAESLADLAIVLQRDAEGAVTLSWNYGNFIQTLITLAPRVTKLEERVSGCDEKYTRVENRVSGIEIKLDALLHKSEETGKDIKDIYHLIMDRHK